MGEALDELPKRFQALLENIVVTVEEEPSEDDDDVLDDGQSDGELFGVFRGLMRTELSFEDPIPELPPQIVIFRGPILRATATRAEAIREIKDTVRHELGHLFGLEDDEMPY